eukprot:9137495-Pyramimonas_sp.AAC.1
MCGILYRGYNACAGSYEDPSRPVWDPITSLHGMYGILYRACTACVGSYTEPTRPAWDPIQSLHGMCGLENRGVSLPVRTPPHPLEKPSGGADSGGDGVGGDNCEGTAGQWWGQWDSGTVVGT